MSANYDDAPLIIHDAMLQANESGFMFVEFPENPELDGKVLFWCVSTPEHIAQVLGGVMSSRDLSYDDEVAPPLFLYMVDPKHIYARCYRPSHLERLRRRQLRDEAEANALLDAADRSAAEREGKALAQTMSDAILAMLERQNGGKA